MKRVSAIIVLLFTIALSVGTAKAQEKNAVAEMAKTAQSWSFYKLDFNVREIDNGKPLNTRSYTLNMRSGGGGSQIRVGTRVPYTGEKGPSYMDVGFNVDCRIEDQQGSQALEVRTDLSSLPTGDQAVEKNGMPLLRSLRTSSVIPIVLNKPILVASVDEVGSTHRMQVEVTITQMK